MTTPLGSADFFALEAGECLDRLEVIITRPAGPAPDELLRYARALRGSALMANKPAIARAAAGFEGLARAVRDRGRVWDSPTRERAAQAVDELRHLVRRARTWTDADTGDATRLALDLDALAGGAPAEVFRPAQPVSSDPTGVNPGVRAFVAREGALIASALDRAARALEATPEAREPLYAVLRRMQSLRGLAELGDLMPLPEILDGVELAVADLTRLFAPPPGVAALLDAAAAALTRVGRDVAERGRPDPDPDEARRFTEQLLRAFAVEADVLPIESLYVDGDEAPFRRSTAQPQFAPPVALGTVELVSYGEHLRQSADRAAEAPTGTARDLRLYGLVATLRSVSTPGTDPVTPALAVFGRSAREAIGSGAAASSVEQFAAALREAGALLRGLADGGEDHETGRRLLDAAHRLDLLRDGDVTPRQEAEAPRADMPPDMPPVDIESLAYDGESAIVAVRGELPVVPIESLAPDPAPAPAHAPVAAPPGAREPAGTRGDPGDRTPIERAFAAYGRLVRARSGEAASLDAYRPGRTAAPAAAPAAAPVPDLAGDVPVDILTLCYRGRAALERAAVVRSRVGARLAARADFAAVEPLVRELLDLVPLALEHAD